jgi:Domain of unknown function (DUF4886)
MTLAHHGRRLTLMAALLAGFALAGAASAGAADGPKVKPTEANAPKHALFLGNSYLYYNDGLHIHARRMASAADPEHAKAYSFKLVAISSGSLRMHDIKRDLIPGELGIKEPFSFVVLQGNSGAALSEKKSKDFETTVTAFAKEAGKHGVRTALYMTHAYVKPNKKASPDMMGKIEKLYLDVGNKIGALVIPVGLAFQEAYNERPGLKLQQSYDGSHPTLLGTYLAACVVYASLYDRSPVGNPYDYYGAVDKDTALFLQKVADKTVRKFYGQPLAGALSAK